MFDSIPRMLLVAMFLGFLLSSNLTTAFAQVPSELAEHGILARDWLYGLRHDLEDHWKDLDDASRFRVYSDLRTASDRFDSALANYKNSLERSLKEMKESYFFAVRGQYRVAILLAENAINEAEKKMLSVPPYLSKPSDAQVLFEKALEEFRSWNRTDWMEEDPTRRNDFTEYFDNTISIWKQAKEELRQEVFPLPKQVAEIVDRYLNSEGAIKQREISQQLSGINNKLYGVAIFTIIPFGVVVFYFRPLFKISTMRSLRTNGVPPLLVNKLGAHVQAFTFVASLNIGLGIATFYSLIDIQSTKARYFLPFSLLDHVLFTIPVVAIALQLIAAMLSLKMRHNSWKLLLSFLATSVAGSVLVLVVSTLTLLA